jgi:hypothetical protein
MNDWNKLFEDLRSIYDRSEAVRTKDCPSIEVLYEAFFSDEHKQDIDSLRRHVLSCKYCLTLYGKLNKALQPSKKPLSEETKLRLKMINEHLLDLMNPSFWKSLPGIICERDNKVVRKEKLNPDIEPNTFNIRIDGPGVYRVLTPTGQVLAKEDVRENDIFLSKKEESLITKGKAGPELISRMRRLYRGRMDINIVKGKNHGTLNIVIRRKAQKG